MNLADHEKAVPAHWRILVTSWLGWLSVFASLMLFIFLASRYAAELKMTPGDVSRLKSFALGMSGFGGLVFGAFGDRFGRRPAIIWSLLLSVAGLALAATAKDGDQMLAAAIIGAFGIGGQWASGQTLVGETVPPALRARFGAISQSGAPLGLTLATFALIASEHMNWRTIFWIGLVQVALVPWCLLAIPESDLWLERRALVRSGAAHEGARFAELFAKDARRPFIVAFILTWLTMSNYWFTVTWLPEFMKSAWNLSIAKSGYWTFAFVTGSLAGYTLFSITQSRIGRRPAFTLFAFVMALGTAMLTVFQGAIRHEPRLVLVFAFLAGVGTGLWASFGPLYTEVFPTRVRATAGGICMNVSRGAQFVGPLLIGAGHFGTGVALAGAFGIAAGLAIWLLPDVRAKRLFAD